MLNAKAYKEATGAKLLGWSSVWDFHSVIEIDTVAYNKNSNLHKHLAKIFKTGVKSVTLIVSGIGRSAHSETSIAIFEGATNINEWSEYYTYKCGEVHAHTFKQYQKGE